MLWRARAERLGTLTAESLTIGRLQIGDRSLALRSGRSCRHVADGVNRSRNEAIDEGIELRPAELADHDVGDGKPDRDRDDLLCARGQPTEEARRPELPMGRGGWSAAHLIEDPVSRLAYRRAGLLRVSRGHARTKGMIESRRQSGESRGKLFDLIMPAQIGQRERLTARELGQTVGKIPGSGHESAADEDGNNGNATGEHGLDFHADPVIVRLESTLPIGIPAVNPPRTDHGQCDIRRIQRIAQPPGKVLPGSNLAVAKNHRIAESLGQIILEPAGEALRILPTVGDENSAQDPSL